MPRLCPYCHKLGIPARATLFGVFHHVECRICHNVSRRKLDWTFYIPLIVPIWTILALYVFQFNDVAMFDVVIITLLVAIILNHARAEFVPMVPPPRENQ